jgi:hypothetical protein
MPSSGDGAAAGDNVDGVVAGCSRYRQGVAIGAAVDGVDAIADGVVEGVVAGAAAEVVVAERAGDDVGDVVADDDIAGLATGGVLNVDQNVGADVDTLRIADRHGRRVSRVVVGIGEQVTDRVSAECRLTRAVIEIEIDEDAVSR